MHDFYKQLRNPLFHGYEISDDHDARDTAACVGRIEQVHAWSGTWSEPFREFDQSAPY
jgi:hypothetical protein